MRRVQTIGAVDLGTNSTRLLLAEVADGRIRELRREVRITRLGHGVDATGALAEEAIARVLAVLACYRDIAAAAGVTRVRATATSAVRDAANGAAFLERVRDLTGFETDLLTGEEEAALTVAGVLSGRPDQPGPLLIIDVGGGSTELALVASGEPIRTVSINVGCVRATERWLVEGPISQRSIESARDAVRELLVQNAPGFIGRDVVAVAGTAITAAAIDLEIASDDDRATEGHRVSAALLDDLVRRLAPLSLAERERVTGLAPARAPVIVGGLVVLSGVLRHVGATSFAVSIRDILHGTALALARPVP